MSPSTVPFLKNSTSTSTAAARPFSSSPQKLAGGEHHHGSSEDMYDTPGGWLWGQNPREKYEEEGWEKLWYWGFLGGLGVATAAYQFKPDTTIETWALEEARRRLQAEGILPETK
ncbi:NADH:ubiquinone oxidoreductase 11.6kD subunit [Phyllosticta citriasiana]|uniref:NADH dehydrogenase [ubiquinone] 1 beta subcomplex subunit 11, mitochondrial n=1 Tax=Phyllosticta citriasiana TaxID=595635 RepID=A0ABR1KD13_9PEZI